MLWELGYNIDLKGDKPLSKKTFLWIEDRTDKSGFIFWKTLMAQLFPEVIVESKKNNSELDLCAGRYLWTG